MQCFLGFTHQRESCWRRKVKNGGVMTCNNELLFNNYKRRLNDHLSSYFFYNCSCYQTTRLWWPPLLLPVEETIKCEKGRKRLKLLWERQTKAYKRQENRATIFCCGVGTSISATAAASVCYILHCLFLSTLGKLKLRCDPSQSKRISKTWKRWTPSTLKTVIRSLQMKNRSNGFLLVIF